MARTAVAYLRPPDVCPLPADVTPRDTDLVAFVSEPDETGRERLRTALARIAAGEAETLFLVRLGAGAESLGELIRLLDWLDDAGASLLAADVGTRHRRAQRPAGRRTAA